MPRKKTPTAEDFLNLQSRLAEWRSSHRPRSPLPEELWTAAVELARKHGLHRTARTLPMDYAGLRQRLGPMKQRGVVRPHFVEVFPPAGKAGCLVEILRVQMSDAVDWDQLL